MRINKTYILYGAILFVCVGFFVANIFTHKNGSQTFTVGSKEENYAQMQPHTLRFFESELFYKAVARYSDFSNNNGQAKIIGGIVPHHLLASDVIANFFSHIKNQHPKTIILIGPNHYEKGNGPVLTGEAPWNTPFGNVQVEGKITDNLVSSGVAVMDDNVLEYEHSVGGIMPFIKYYLSDSKVVPLVVSSRVSEEKKQALADAVINIIKNSDVIAIASVDFSHYLTKEEAEKKDLESLDAIRKFDYRAISQFSNGHLDSPVSIITLLKVMEKNKTVNITELAHTNSGELLHNSFVETTTHFAMAFSK